MTSVERNGGSGAAADINRSSSGRKNKIRRRVGRVVAQKTQTDEHNQGQQSQCEYVVSESFVVEHREFSVDSAGGAQR